MLHYFIWVFLKILSVQIAEECSLLPKHQKIIILGKLKVRNCPKYCSLPAENTLFLITFNMELLCARTTVPNMQLSILQVDFGPAALQSPAKWDF